MKKLFVISVLVFVWFVPFAGAVPMMVNYQGLVNVEDLPYTGTGYFRFALVNSADDAQYWSNDGLNPPESDLTIEVAEGLFEVLIGDPLLMNTLSLSVFQNDELFLKVWFRDDAGTVQLLAPNRRIVSTGFAIYASEAANSLTVDGMSGADLEESAEIDSDIAVHEADASAHHVKTNSFAELMDTAVDAQIPDDITIDHAGTSGSADTLDGLDSAQFLRNDTDGTLTGTLNVTDALGVGVASPGDTVDINGAVTIRGDEDNTPHGTGLTSDEESIRIAGTTSDYIIAVQDGSGRVQHYWNSTTASPDNLFLTAGENASMIDWNPRSDMEFNLLWADGSMAMEGDAISWFKPFSVILNTGDLAIAGDANITGDADISGDADIAGDLTAETVTAAEIYGGGPGDPVLDQLQNVTTQVGTPNSFWQSFTPAVSGWLLSIEYSDYGTRTPGLLLEIYLGEGTGGILLSSSTSDLVSGSSAAWGSLAVTDNVYLYAEQLYTFQVSGIFDDSGCRSDSSNPYTRGKMNGSTTTDLGFKTYMSSSDHSGLVLDGYNRVGIGTGLPARSLHVNDVLRLEPRSSAPIMAEEGDIYMDSSTHKLRVHDGTSWQACW